MRRQEKRTVEMQAQPSVSENNHRIGDTFHECPLFPRAMHVVKNFRRKREIHGVYK